MTVTRVALVIPNLDGEKMLRASLESLAGQDYRDFETVVVDNGSADGSAAMVEKEFPGVQLMRLGRNLGFAGAVNRGVAATRTPLVVLLNNDMVAAPGWLSALVAAEDVTRPKPAPDTYLLAAELLKVDPRRCRAFEDTDLGLESARAAGMEAIDIRCLRSSVG